MVITLTGDNAYLLQQTLQELVDNFVREHGDLALERHDGEEASFEKLQESLQSLPFLASKKLVILRSPGANKQFAEQSEKLLTQISEATDLVIIEPKLDKRSSYYKFLKKSTDYREFTTPDSRSLGSFMQAEAAKYGAKISTSDATYLIERIGNNQQMLASEIHKLALYNRVITRQTIDELTEATPQGKIFDLIDAAFSGNHKKALRLYSEQRKQKVEPQAIIGMIAWQLHILAMVSSAGKELTSDDIAKTAKLSPFVVSKTQGIARKLSLAQVQKLVLAALELDYASKTKAYDLDEALQNYILAIN